MAGKLAEAGLEVIGIEAELVGGDGALVGATSMGPSGGEALAVLTLAVHARIPVRTMKGMISAYPTFHRAIDSALWS